MIIAKPNAKHADKLDEVDLPECANLLEEARGAISSLHVRRKPCYNRAVYVSGHFALGNRRGQLTLSEYKWRAEYQ